MRALLLLALSVIALSACSDTRVTGTSPDFLSMSIVSGDGQTGLPGQTLPDPMVVRIETTRGRKTGPASGVLVNFVVTQGGGSMYAGTGMTDENGVASDWWTLGPEEGPNELEVRAVHGAAGVKELYGSFSATGADTQGPVTSGLSVLPMVVGPGQTVSVDARIDESSTGGSGVASAEFNVDGGSWSPMSPVDGAFDESAEDVEATLFAQGTLGQVVTVCVRGSDLHGNLGSPECTTFSVEDLVGPAARRIFFLPEYAESGEIVTIYADLDDASTGNSAISSADVRINDGTWDGMLASDGAFDQPLETVQSSFQASGAMGDYMSLCVQGTDAVSNVGEIACRFLTIIDPSSSLKGYLDPSGTEVVLEWVPTAGAVTHRIETKLASWPDDAWEVLAIYAGPGNSFTVTEDSYPFFLSEIWDFRVTALGANGEVMAVHDIVTVVVP